MAGRRWLFLLVAARRACGSRSVLPLRSVMSRVTGFLSHGAPASERLFQPAAAACRAAFINFLGCMWYYVASCEGLENSWLNSVGAPLHPCC